MKNLKSTTINKSLWVQKYPRAILSFICCLVFAEREREPRKVIAYIPVYNAKYKRWFFEEL